MRDLTLMDVLTMGGKAATETEPVVQSTELDAVTKMTQLRENIMLLSSVRNMGVAIHDPANDKMDFQKFMKDTNHQKILGSQIMELSRILTRESELMFGPILERSSDE